MVRHEGVSPVANGVPAFVASTQSNAFGGRDAQPRRRETARPTRNIGATREFEFQSVAEGVGAASPYGDFPHAQGLQRVSFEAAKTMERNFATIGAKASRLFAGAPMFVGHPDVPQFANQFPDRKAYGWIMALEARPDGLYGRMKWSPAGLQLLENGHYKFLSPYWEARQIGEQDGRPVFEPVALISAGLTNEPNLPLQPLANTRGVTAQFNWRILTTRFRDALANGRLDAGSDRFDAARACGGLGCGDREVAGVADRDAHAGLHGKIGRAQRGVAYVFRIGGFVCTNMCSEKMRDGLSYDQAWNAVKEEHPACLRESQLPSTMARKSRSLMKTDAAFKLFTNSSFEPCRSGSFRKLVKIFPIKLARIHHARGWINKQNQSGEKKGKP